MLSLHICTFWLVLVGWTNLVTAGDQLTIGSFNIQIFGQTKMSKPKVVDALLKILPKFDLTLIMEIRDTTEEAFPQLVKLLNEKTAADDKFEYVIGERIGRSDSKEQYAYLYRLSKVKVVDHYGFSDRSDKFEREPFVARFQPQVDVSVKDFFMIGLHTKPTDTPAEIERLKNVFASAYRKYKIKDAIIAGDLNADCSYFNVGQKKKSKMYNHSSYKWLVPDHFDTTTKASDCAYDRFIATGKLMNEGVLTDVEVYRFDKILGLDQKTTEDVSDHFPIYMKLN